MKNEKLTNTKPKNNKKQQINKNNKNTNKPK